jgi:hypothetical protein
MRSRIDAGSSRTSGEIELLLCSLVIDVPQDVRAFWRCVTVSFAPVTVEE